MGTLGCINDMMRRDKENRELRKAGKERLNETRNRLIDLNKKGHSSHLSLEQLEEIRIKTQEKEEAETHQLFKIKLIMLGIVLIAGVLIWIGITFFSLKFHSLFSFLFLEKTNKNSYICDTNLE